MGVARYLAVLLGKALHRIDEDNGHIAAVHRHIAAQHAVPLYGVLYLGLAADAGGINEDILAVLVFNDGIGGVTGGAGNIADDHPLLSGQIVDEGAFAHIGLANDSHLGVFLWVVGAVLPVYLFHAGIQQVAGAVPVDRGNRVGVAQPQVIEFVKIGGNITQAVALVDAQNHRLAAFLQHMGNIGVIGGHTAFQVHHKDDHIGGVNGDLCLHPHFGKQHIIGLRLYAAGIHQHKFPSAPFAGGVNAVTGHTGGVLHDGEPLPGELIEQGGFTDIRTPHDGNQRFRHIRSLPFGRNFQKSHSACGGGFLGQSQSRAPAPAKRVSIIVSTRLRRRKFYKKLN